MRISHLNNEKKPKYIKVRNYDNRSIVNFNTSVLTKDNTNEVGKWNVKYIELIPKEYNYLNENLTFLSR